MKALQLKVLFTIVFISHVSNSFSQVIESESSSIHINNKKQKTEIIVDTIPPVLTLISPQIRSDGPFRTDYEKLILVGKATDDGGISTLLVNSKEVIANPDGVFREEMNLKKGENEFRIVAMDKGNNLTERIISVQYIPSYYSFDTLNVKGKYYALLIAINEYEQPDIFDLQNPVRDANSLYNVLTSKYLFDPENISLLQNPTREEIIGSFDKLSYTLKDEDNLFVFYAGHGWWDKEANIGYWLPSNANKTSKTRWVRNSTIRDYLKEIKSKHILLVSDACFSGSIFSARSFFNETSVAITKLYELPSRKAMTSGTLTEVPDESIFVKYFIDRLSKNEEKFLSAEQLFSSFRIAVINNSEVLPQYGVIKDVGDEGGDFIFILR